MSGCESECVYLAQESVASKYSINVSYNYLAVWERVTQNKVDKVKGLFPST